MDLTFGGLNGERDTGMPLEGSAPPSRQPDRLDPWLFAAAPVAQTGVAIARPRLGPNSPDSTSTVERALPSSVV
jgi:hypothetical protein